MPSVGDVEHRRAIDADADLAQIVGDEARREPGGALRLDRGLEARGSGIGRPMRRAHALHAPAFLVDQHRRVGAPDAVAKRFGQRAQLPAIDDVALEQDQAPGARVADERALLGASAGPAQPQTNGERHFGVPGEPRTVNSWR